MLAEVAGRILGVDHCGEGRETVSGQRLPPGHFVVTTVQCVLEWER